MSKKRILLTVLLVLAVTFSFIGCGKKEPDLTGKWIVESEEEKNYFELYSDGTGIIAEADSEGNIQKFSCVWIAEEGRLKFTTDLGIWGSVSDSCEYELTKDILTLKWDDETEIYHKADTLESMETTIETTETLEEDSVEEQVTYECSDEIKAAAPESGMVQIDDMVFTYGSNLSEAISIVDNSLSSFDESDGYNEDKLVLPGDVDYVVFHKNNEAYFELAVKNLSDDTIPLRDCIIIRIISYKASKGNIFYAGFDKKEDAITYDYVRTLMNAYEFKESTYYDKDNNEIISIIYVIPSEVSDSNELWICFRCESDSGELQSLVIGEMSLPSMYGF